MVLSVHVGVIVKVEDHIRADAPIDTVAERAHLHNCQRSEDCASLDIHLDGENSVRNSAPVFQNRLRCDDGYNPQVGLSDLR